MYEGVGEPVPVREVIDYTEPVSPQFTRRSFHRVAFVLGLGGAAYLAWCIYNKNRLRGNTGSAESAIVKDEKSVRISPVVEVNENGAKSNHNIEKDNVNANKTSAESKHLGVKIVLHQNIRGYFTPSIAPFPLKLETFLRVANIGYEVDFSPSPGEDNTKGTPWMTINGEEFSEAHECIAKLEELFHLDLDAGASPSRKIASRLVGVMLENHIYWAIALWRWVFDEGKTLSQIQPLQPSGVASIAEISGSVQRASWYHGLGRLSQSQVVDLIMKDLGDLSAALGKHSYFLGESPGEVDCAAFAMLCQMIWNMPGSPFTAAVKQHSNLIDFVLRMRDNYWPDWDKNRQSPGQEFNGNGMLPGAEFLTKRQLNSAESSQWDSNKTNTTTTSTVTLTDFSVVTTASATTATDKRKESMKNHQHSVNPNSNNSQNISQQQQQQPVRDNNNVDRRQQQQHSMEEATVNTAIIANQAAVVSNGKLDPLIDCINNNNCRSQVAGAMTSQNKFGALTSHQESLQHLRMTSGSVINNQQLANDTSPPTRIPQPQQSPPKPQQHGGSHHQQQISQQQLLQQQEQNYGPFNPSFSETARQMSQSQQRFNYDPHENTKRVMAGMHAMNYTLSNPGSNLNNNSSVSRNHEILNRNSNLNNASQLNNTSPFAYNPPQQPSLQQQQLHSNGNTLQSYQQQDNNSANFRPTIPITTTALSTQAQYGAGNFHPSQASFSGPLNSTQQLYAQSSGNIGTGGFNPTENCSFGSNEFYPEEVQHISPPLTNANIQIPFHHNTQQLTAQNQSRGMQQQFMGQQQQQINLQHQQQNSSRMNF